MNSFVRFAGATCTDVQGDGPPLSSPGFFRCELACRCEETGRLPCIDSRNGRDAIRANVRRDGEQVGIKIHAVIVATRADVRRDGMLRRHPPQSPGDATRTDVRRDGNETISSSASSAGTIRVQVRGDGSAPSARCIPRACVRIRGVEK